MGVNANDFQFTQDRREYVDGQIDLHDASGEAHPDIQVKLLECLEALDGTVKQVDGMGLSANDYSDSEKQKLANALASLSGISVSLQQIGQELTKTVRQEEGMGLSSNDFTDMDKENLQEAHRKASSNESAIKAHGEDTVRHVTQEERAVWDAVSKQAQEVMEDAKRAVNFGVVAEMLDSGSEPTVEKVDDGEEISLVFGIPKGADGYTPQKGVDYFTPEDIESLNIPDQKEFANALKGSARGEVIRIDDVSPLERNVPVKVASKNLWDNSSATPNKGIGTWTITQTGVSFVRNGSTGGTYMFSKKFNITKGTTITFSCSKTGDAALSFYKDKVWGNLLKRTIGNVLSYTATEDTSILPAIIIDSTHNEVVMTDIQVEIGAEPTPYTAYVDVSTVTLSARGKNLLHIPDGVQPDVQTLTQTMENGIVSLKGTVTFTTPPSRSYSPSTGKVLVNYIEATVISLANGAFKLPRGIYTFSESVNDFSCLLVGKLGTKYWDAGGAKIYHANSTFEVTNDETYGLYLWQLEVPTTGQECSIEYAVSYPQLEYGSAATSYEPSIEPVSYPVATDGTVEGVKSIYPNTTLLTDMQGVLINCEYHKDINKVIEELTNAIISLGGNI